MSTQTKHLSLIESEASRAYSALESTYAKSKGKALDLSPSFMATIVGHIEAICQPALTLSQKGASTMLLYADSAVGTGLNLASSTANKTHDTAVKLVGEERMKPVDGLMSSAQAKFNSGYETVQNEGVFRSMKLAAQNAGSYVNAMASSIINQYIKPSGSFAKQQYDGVHDTIVKQPLYAALYNLTTSMGTLIYSLPPVKVPLEFARNRLYPQVEPTVGPYVNSAEKYIGKFEEHIQPRVDPPKRPAKHAEQNAKQATKQATKQAKSTAHQAREKAANGLPDMPQ